MKNETSTDKGGKKSDISIVLSHALEIGKELKIKKFLVDARIIKDFAAMEDFRRKEKIVWIIETDAEMLTGLSAADFKVQIPVKHVSRINLLRMSLFLALLNKYIRPNERVISLCGSRRSTIADTLLIMNPTFEFPWLRKQSLTPIRQLVQDTRTFQRLLEIALRFSEEGREGKPIGTIFVLGDLEQLSPYLSQLMLNPVKGHSRKVRDIYNPQLFESLRELTAIDGAMIINHQGVLERAGAYIAAPTDGIRVKAGLGARHTAAAAITGCSNSLAITISESSGLVNVYCKGKSILELE